MSNVIVIVALLIALGVGIGMIVPFFGFYFWPQPEPGWKDHLRWGSIGPLAVILSTATAATILFADAYVEPGGSGGLIFLSPTHPKWLLGAISIVIVVIGPLSIFYAASFAYCVGKYDFRPVTLVSAVFGIVLGTIAVKSMLYFF